MHFRIVELAVDYAKRMLNLGPYLRFRVFDFASRTADQTLFGVLFIAARARGNRPDHLAILMLRTLVDSGVTRTASPQT